MLTKFVLLLFCGALINAKSLVQRDPRLREIKEEGLDHVRFPGVFKDLMRGLENAEVDQNGYDKVGANPNVQLDDDEFETKIDEEELSSEEITENKVIDENDETKRQKLEAEENANNGDEEDGDEEDDEDKEEEEDDTKLNVNKELEEQNEKTENVEESNDEEDFDESNDEADTQPATKDEKIEEEKSDESLEEETEDEPENELKVNTPVRAQISLENVPKPQQFNAPVGSQNLYQDSFKLAKDYFDSLILSSKNPETKKLVDTFANFVDLKSLAKNVNLESLMQNILPSKKSPPKHHSDDKETDLYKFDQDSLMEQIKNLEGGNEMEEIEANGPEFDLDNPSVGSLIPPYFSKNFNDLQKNFPGLTNFWKKNPANVKLNKPVGVQKDAKVGFGGWNNQNKLIFGDLTKYVNKAVNQAQAQLDQTGRVITANNPPLSINLIPGCPIIFNLKRVEGANTLDTYGQSKGIHYNKLYAFTQYKFTELRYYYDVIIKPLNLFSIRKSITIILNDAPTKMSVSVEKDNKMKVMAMEFVKPVVSLDVGSHRYVNYGINYLVNEYLHPVVKQKLVEIVSRDSKLLLTKYLEDAQ